MQNTVILYDLENLIKGYNNAQTIVQKVSLKNILESIKKIEGVGDIAIQRAYANWSDYRLRVMAQEISELGIEPIQIFGFSRNQKKNAADIQLAVDAVDLSYVRPWLNVFVIVSGDGGFSALAKKLHECGRTVIGCAYQSSTNKIFESVCDVFICLDEPISPANSGRKTSLKSPNAKQKITHSLKITNPIIIRLSQSLERLSSHEHSAIIQQSREIINWFVNDQESSSQLKTQGIYISVIKEAFKYGIENFDPSLIGLSKFITFLQFITTGTELKVINSAKNEVKVLWRTHNLDSFDSLPDIAQDYIHSVPNYASILETSNPRFQMVNFEILRQVIALIKQLESEAITVNYLIDYIKENKDQDLDAEGIKLSTTNLFSANILEESDEETSLSEKNLSLQSQYEDEEAIVDKIKMDMYNKLVAFWKDGFREDIFEELIYRLDMNLPVSDP